MAEEQPEIEAGLLVYSKISLSLSLSFIFQILLRSERTLFWKNNNRTSWHLLVPEVSGRPRSSLPNVLRYKAGEISWPRAGERRTNFWTTS